MRGKSPEYYTTKEKRKVDLWLKTLGPKLQEFRRQAQLSQEQLAEELDISVNTVKYIEQGRRLPSLEMLLRILIHLDTNLTVP